MRRLSLLAALAVAATTAADVASAQSRPDLTGSWERYRGPAGDATNPPPESPPPLKANLLAEWEARNAARRAADARGEPLASNVTHCIPDGVPSMMKPAPSVRLKLSGCPLSFTTRLSSG